LGFVVSNSMGSAKPRGLSLGVSGSVRTGASNTNLKVSV
jgi:hypothetical protein